jgi:hypothetical protein
VTAPPLRTVGGITLSVRLWALLRDAYAEAGLDPDKYLVVVQGSYNSTVAASGSTHRHGGAVDLRVWNLPTLDHRGKIVRALRRRNVAAWERSERTGSWDAGDHIHGIHIDDGDLSSGAEWQVQEFLAGRDGLSRRGKDYHPRPRRWLYLPIRADRVKPGKLNADVRRLQTRLGMPTRYRTGFYGAKTRAAVRARFPQSGGVVAPSHLRRLCFWVV